MRKKFCLALIFKRDVRLDIEKVLCSKKSIKRWAYVFHENTDINPHYHVYMDFGNSAINLATVASWFGVDNRYITETLGQRSVSLRYLVHKDDLDKVISNFNIETEIASLTSQV